MKNIRIFYLKYCHFLVVKFSVYLNRRVFVMLYMRCQSWLMLSVLGKAFNRRQFDDMFLIVFPANRV